MIKLFIHQKELIQLMQNLIGKPLVHISKIASFTGVCALLAFAISAQAKPIYGVGYPRFKYEGSYPEHTPCRYHLQDSRTAQLGDRPVTLKYFYSGGCGSYARIDNAPGDCSVFLDRTYNNTYNNSDSSTWANVIETVDPGINFAYTKVGNNLNGRLSRAALVCNGVLLNRTNWY